jgi:hypothetical protein
MKTIFDFLFQNQLLHWVAALAGIISLLLVRICKVKGFSMRYWVNENLIGLLWSLFFLSLTATMTAVYVPEYTLTEAFFTGYCGAHVIFRLNKEPKNYVRPPRVFHRHQHR